MAGRHYRDLEVWRKAMDLVTELYSVTGRFPSDEMFGLTSQLRRSAVSVPANIAEGQGRIHDGDFLHHLSIARGSLTESETHILIATRLGYISEERCTELWDRCQEVGRLLNGLIRSLGAGRHSKPDP